MNIKIIKDYENYKKGDKVQVDSKLGLKLIKSGFAIIHKEMIFTKEK